MFAAVGGGEVEAFEDNGVVSRCRPASNSVRIEVRGGVKCLLLQLESW
jgi:hypothetical protein